MFNLHPERMHKSKATTQVLLARVSEPRTPQLLLALWEKQQLAFKTAQLLLSAEDGKFAKSQIPRERAHVVCLQAG